MYQAMDAARAAGTKVAFTLSDSFVVDRHRDDLKRLLAEGRDLYWWHPLVSGDPETVHAAGISVRGRVAGPEEDFSLQDLLDRVVTWPAEAPPA